MPKADGKTIQQRFDERYEIDPVTGCWNWIAGLNGKQYAYIWIPIDRPNARHKGDGNTLQAYKVGWILKYDLPWSALDGFELHHTCENTKCVNPDHVEQLTPLEHKLRSKNIISDNVAKTTCPRGHPYSHTNNKGSRCCRICATMLRKRKEG